jgi:predicted transcriptional regulator
MQVIQEGMSKTAVIAAGVDEETLTDLRQLAERFGCTVEHLVTTAVVRFVNEERATTSGDFDGLPPYVDPDPLARNLADAERRTVEAWRAYLQPALDDLEAGRTVDHEELMQQMRERYRSRNAA